MDICIYSISLWLAEGNTYFFLSVLVLVWIQSFSSPWPVVYIQTKEPSLPEYLPKALLRRISKFMAVLLRPFKVHGNTLQQYSLGQSKSTAMLLSSVNLAFQKKKKKKAVLLTPFIVHMHTPQQHSTCLSKSTWIPHSSIFQTFQSPHGYSSIALLSPFKVHMNTPQQHSTGLSKFTWIHHSSIL